jgi:DNA modification methylase
MRHTAILYGDAWDLASTREPQSIECIVTSPPYWGLRDYGHPDQFGLERTPQEYVAKLVDLFARLRPALKDEGTLWLNLGDSYHASQSGNGGYSAKSTLAGFTSPDTKGRLANDSGERRALVTGLKPKDLVGIPWRVAFALQEDGWYLRSDIIWSKPNPMPESVTDRPTKAHEYVFLLSKRERYYYDAEAIAEPVAPSTVERVSQPGLEYQAGSSRVPGKTNGTMKAALPRYGGDKRSGGATYSGNEYDGGNGKRNARTVWTITTKPYSGAHFATMPPELAERCIKAGCPEGGTVLDPFLGSGTTAEVARKLGRNAVGFELNEDYRPLIEKRLAQGVLL